MADEATDSEEQVEGEEAPEGGGKGRLILGLVLPPMLAGAGAFGGATVAVGRAVINVQAAPVPTVVNPAPGPTKNFRPFVVSVRDKDGRKHAVKLSIAVELAHDAKEEEFTSFVPRVRDAALKLLRAMSFEEIGDMKRQEQMRTDLLKEIHGLGAKKAERVLFTDFVIQ